MQVEQISVTESSADGAVRMTVGSQVRNEQDEPAVVLAAREILAGWRHPDDFDAVFDEATVYARRPSHPGVLVTDIPGCGRWAAVFSTAQRLAHQFGDGPFFVTTGADLLAQLPPGVVVMLDPGDAPGRSAKSFWLVTRCFEGWDAGLGCSGAGVGCS